jgi:putative transposase
MPEVVVTPTTENSRMRFRLYPDTRQEWELREHCAHARFTWNLALEQSNWYRPEWGPTPGFVAQCRQLTEARAASAWLRGGSVMVQQQALRDFAQAMANFYRGTHRRPTWRKKDVHEGFRVVAVGEGQVRRLNRRWGEVLVPKTGWVRFRWTRRVSGVKSYRVTCDRAGRWHVAFAVTPESIARTPTAAAVGVDRGVVNTLATSDGALLHCPGLSKPQRARLARLQRQLVRRQRNSNSKSRRNRTKLAIARLKARDADQAKDWVEKTTTALVVGYDLIAIEALPVRTMTRSARGTIAAPGSKVRQKAGLNRSILAARWGLFARRLREKCTLAGVLLIEINPANTSRRCVVCGCVAVENRKSQAVFGCITCGHTAHADVNAALNILAAGRAVAAQGGAGVVAPVNCEPQHVSSTAA